MGTELSDADNEMVYSSILMSDGDPEAINVYEEEPSQIDVLEESERSGNGCSEENCENFTTSVETSQVFAGICRSLSTKEMMSYVEAELKRRYEQETTNDVHTETAAIKERLELLASEGYPPGNAVQPKEIEERSKAQLAEVENAPFKDKILTDTKEESSKERNMAQEEGSNLHTDTKGKIATFATLDASRFEITQENISLLDSAIQLENENKQARVKAENFRQRQELLQQIIIDNSNIDVAFLVDCTHSMSPYIDNVKLGIEHVVENITNKFESKMKVAFVGYRDYRDGRKKIQCFQFTDSIANFKKNVCKVSASGGDDFTEDVLGGLEAAIRKLRWTSKNKVLFHIADAPHHGSRFHNLGKEADHYFDKQPRGLSIEYLMKEIRRLNILYVFTKINNTTDKMIKEFNRVAGRDIVKYLDLKSPNLIGELLLNASEDLIKSSAWESMRGFEMISAGHGGIKFNISFFYEPYFSSF